MEEATCISGLGFQSGMQAGFRVFRRLQRNTPSLSERAKSTRSTSGLVTPWVGGITPLMISHCLACRHSSASRDEAILPKPLSSRSCSLSHAKDYLRS